LKTKITLAARIILGLIFFVLGGLNGLFQFIPMPEPSPEGMAYLGSLMKTGYFFPLLKATELAAGAFLLSGFFVPLALILLAPIVVNIILYHLYLDPQGLPLAVIIVVLEVFLIHSYWLFFKGMLTKKAKIHE